jgi:hypothetical protein
MKYNHYLVNILPDKRWKCVCCEKSFSNSTKKSKHQNTETHEMKLFQYRKDKLKQIEAERNE